MVCRIYIFLIGLIIVLGIFGCSDPAADFEKAVLTNTPDAYHSFLNQHQNSMFADSARYLLRAAAAWDSANQAATIGSYQQFEKRFPSSLFKLRVKGYIDSIARDSALTFIAAQESFAKLPQSISEVEKKYDTDTSLVGFSALEKQAILDFYLHQLKLKQYQSYSIQNIQPLKGEDPLQAYILNKSFSGSGSITGQGDDLKFKGRYDRNDGMIAGSILWGLGNYSETDAWSYKFNFPGNVTISPHKNKAKHTFITELSNEQVYFKINMFMVGDFVFPMGTGSVYRFKGKVENLFPGHIFIGNEQDPLCFILLPDLGLTYIMGSGKVVLTSGEEVPLATHLYHRNHFH